MIKSWNELIQQESKKDYYKKLVGFLKSEKLQKHIVYPELNNIFRAFKLTPFESVRVLILGQDPYVSVDQANGLCFAVNESTSMPPSLQNVFKEVSNEYDQFPKSRTLEGWAKQGVLLLNTVLTVKANEPFSHRGRGWETFTDEVIKKINEKESPVVYLLWGNAAQQKIKFITNQKHIILKSAHPSPLSANKGFFGNGHFKKVNEIFVNNQIDWIES